MESNEYDLAFVYYYCIRIELLSDLRDQPGLVEAVGRDECIGAVTIPYAEIPDFLPKEPKDTGN